jgi:uncharacterized Fe-S cluster-containing radical SAM superfamily protein
MAKFIRITIVETEQVIRINIDNIIFYVAEPGGTQITHISPGGPILAKESVAQVDELIKNAW